MKDVLKEITRLCLERNWSEEDLAEKAGLSQTNISAWYQERRCPSVESLDKLCAAFGMTLSQFFAEGDDLVSLTPAQKELLDNWWVLSEKQQETFLALLKSLKA